MSLSRRKFIKTSVLFGASAYLLFGNPRHGVASVLAADELPSVVLQDPVYSFTKETFEPYIGSYFEVGNGRGKMVALKLLKVDAYQTSSSTRITTARAAETESFSLLFSPSGPLPGFTSIHTLKHGALGDFKVFLSRKDTKGELFYEAVFNRVR